MIFYACLNFSLSGPQIISYQGCDLDNTDGQMSKDTGKFKAKTAGVYQLYFTARSPPRKSSFVDIAKGSSLLTRIGCHEGDPMLSITLITKMEENEEVYAEIVYGHHLYSNENSKIIFGGFLLYPL